MREPALFIKWRMFPAAPWTEAHIHVQPLHVVEARVSALLPRWMLQRDTFPFDVGWLTRLKPAGGGLAEDEGDLLSLCPPRSI